METHEETPHVVSFSRPLSLPRSPFLFLFLSSSFSSPVFPFFLFFSFFFYSPTDRRSLNLASPLSLLTLTRAFNNRGYVFCEMYGEVAPRGFNVGKARQKEREREREREERERDEKATRRKSVYTGSRNAPRCDSKSRAVKKRTNGKKERKVKGEKEEEQRQRWRKRKERERERKNYRLWAARRKVLKASAFIRQTPPRSASFHHFLLPLPFTVSCTAHNQPRNRAALGNHHGAVAITGTAILFVHAR